ncbi:hypothetical protein D3H65_15005 [Paraflavitalea soli]|uniref:Thioredoxin domain-containing protein n=1 Tax=Paraflavitalea soli TaxID=2315862 RepID=A0A3B7MY10_9BACT|nr:metallophosphoesterase [Paraflavitalea soli]AXY75211.1 hypothetical protein D3H65_15005 [Paraflavitalea soli]
MKTKDLFCLTGWLLCTQLCWSQSKAISENKIVIIEGPIQTRADLLTLNVNPFRYDRFAPWIVKEIKQPLKNGYVRWEVNTKVPVALMNGFFSRNMAYLAEPGDAIYITHCDNNISFSGKGSEKFRLSKMVEAFLDTIKRSPEGLSDGDRAPASSLDDYLAWNDYLNRKTKAWLILLNNERKNISEIAYLDLKDRVLRHIEKIRMHKFHSIRRSAIIGRVNQYGLSNEDLCRIYDSTMDNPSSKWLRFERNYIFPSDYPWEMLHDENYRRRGIFFNTNESDTAVLGRDPADAFVSIYNMIKEKYKGIVRESLLAYTFYDNGGALKALGFTPKIEAILADYYAQPGYPDFKKCVREVELEQRGKWNLINAPAFRLTDSSGKMFNSNQTKGKVVVLDFWFTGCSGCVQMAPAMRRVEEYFSKDTNIIFLSISIDKRKEQWKKSIAQGKYTSGTGLQLYTEGEGSRHEVIKKLLVESYPALEVIDQNGLFVKSEKRKIDPRNDSGKAMIAFLQKQLAILKDGPYIFYEGENAVAYSINAAEFSKQYFTKSNPAQLQVQTDGPNTFTVVIKPFLETEAAEYPKPEKLFVLSDVEGNFDQFRKLLQCNKVIDSNYNWIFGNGHLVFAGDMFDRGLQVTECLWLIYSLEEKARAVGGYVHFILGNHEIMNLQGQHDYVKAKYETNAMLIGKRLIQLYNEDSELGKWLRTKNVVEKIGNILFVHGGISQKINHLSLGVAEINKLARLYYAINKPKYEYNNQEINSIMNPKTSPFWYRSYYDGKEGMEATIDSTLLKFNVNHIVTGHTIVADTISVHYGGKVINTDTHHSESKSEALFIDGGNYYRVNDKGARILLFSENGKSLSNVVAD